MAYHSYIIYYVYCMIDTQLTGTSHSDNHNINAKPPQFNVRLKVDESPATGIVSS